MTIAELIKSFIDSSRERIKTPITGAYMIAFLLYNWRPLSIYLFSGYIIEGRIAQIDKKYCGWDAILVPLAVSIIYTAFVPYIMLVMEQLTFLASEKRITIKAKKRSHYLKAQEGLIYQEFINEELKTGKRNQEEITAEIKNYKEKIESLNSKLNETEDFYKKELQRQEEKVKHLREHESTTLTFANIRNEDVLSEEELQQLCLELTAVEMGEFKRLFGRLHSSSYIKTHLDKNVRNRLLSLELISKKDEYVITRKGFELYAYLLKHDL